MRKFTAYNALAAAGAMLAAAGPAMAANPVTSGTTLTGATGVNVGGVLYDLAFVDGTCATVFGSCPGGFAFSSQAAAQTAANALLAQVLLGTYDSDPTLTNGCSVATICSILIPYALDGQTIFFVSANNKATNDTGTGTFFPLSASTADQASQTWARFTRSTAVPEPTSWALMLLGFGGIGLALRRGRRGAWLARA